MIAEFYLNFLVWFIALCIYILPFYGLVKLIKALIRRSKKKKQERVSHQYATGWRWDESRQLWVHPNSEKGTTANSEYRYKSDELPKEPQIKVTVDIPEEVKKKVQEKKVAQFSEDIPNEDWRTINDYNYKPPVYTPTPPKTNKYAEYEGAYEARPILTDNERRNFKILKAAADNKNYSVGMKVRLADLVKPKGGADYMAKFRKVSQKHVDFVIYDEYARVKAIIELDDRTHDRKDRQDRDEFVDTILRNTGYIVIHTRYITPNILDGI